MKRNAYDTNCMDQLAIETPLHTSFTILEEHLFTVILYCTRLFLHKFVFKNVYVLHQIINDLSFKFCSCLKSFIIKKIKNWLDIN